MVLWKEGIDALHGSVECRFLFPPLVLSRMNLTEDFHRLCAKLGSSKATLRALTTPPLIVFLLLFFSELCLLRFECGGGGGTGTVQALLPLPSVRATLDLEYFCRNLPNRPNGQSNAAALDTSTLETLVAMRSNLSDLVLGLIVLESVQQSRFLFTF